MKSQFKTHQSSPKEGVVHLSGKSPSLVTHQRGDGLTAHLRGKGQGPSGKQKHKCIKYGGEKESMVGESDGRLECALKTWNLFFLLLFGWILSQANLSVCKTNVTWPFGLNTYFFLNLGMTLRWYLQLVPVMGSWIRPFTNCSIQCPPPPPAPPSPTFCCTTSTQKWSMGSQMSEEISLSLPNAA